MKEPKDKRTKEWKEWKANFDKQKGVGDIVEQITEATGIKSAVKLFTNGKDCGCDKRKEQLNKLFSGNKPNCFTEEQYNAWTDLKNRENQSTLTNKQQDLIITLLKDILNMSVKPCRTCGGKIWLTWMDKIDKVYEQYQN